MKRRDDQNRAVFGSQPKIGQPDGSPCEPEMEEGGGSLPDVHDPRQILQIRIACDHLGLLISSRGIYDRVSHG